MFPKSMARMSVSRSTILDMISVRRYSSETKGRHFHEDLFIAKIDRKVDRNGWTGNLDMPEEFLSMD